MIKLIKNHIRYKVYVYAIKNANEICREVDWAYRVKFCIKYKNKIYEYSFLEHLYYMNVRWAIPADWRWCWQMNYWEEVIVRSFR